VAFKIPTFNVWMKIYYALAVDDDDATVRYQGPYWIKGQLRTTLGHSSNDMEAELPKWAAVRNIEQTPFGVGDVLQVAGYNQMYWFILTACDVGPGFANEHRTVFLVPPQDRTWNGARGFFPRAVDIDAVPPDGALMVPLIPPGATDIDPDLIYPVDPPGSWPDRWPIGGV